jgi:DNA adenine methylase
MPATNEISPLRYPGGKGALAPYFKALLAAQPTKVETFVEPFAGGGGAALRLLVDGSVERIVLNDMDSAIAAMWRAVVNESEKFAALIEKAPITIDDWRAHKATHGKRNDGSLTDLELGFATFFLNRTNRSGIIDAWPIGGLKQAGEWKLDCRFNRASLAAKVRKIGKFKDQITISQQDGAKLLAGLSDAKTFIYADPPYLVKGSDLYLNAMTWADHQGLANVFAASSARWLITYDQDARIRELYPDLRTAEFSIGHTAGKPHVGKEFAVFGPGVVVPSLDGLGRDGVFVE